MRLTGRNISLCQRLSQNRCLVYLCLFHHTFVFWTFIPNDQLYQTVIIYIMYLIHYIVQPLNFCEKFVVVVTPLDNTLLFPFVRFVRRSTTTKQPNRWCPAAFQQLSFCKDHAHGPLSVSLFCSFGGLMRQLKSLEKDWILFISRDERVVLTFNGSGGHFDFLKGWNVKKQLSVNHNCSVNQQSLWVALSLYPGYQL